MGVLYHDQDYKQFHRPQPTSGPPRQLCTACPLLFLTTLPLESVTAGLSSQWCPCQGRGFTDPLAGEPLRSICAVAVSSPPFMAEL